MIEGKDKKDPQYQSIKVRGEAFEEEIMVVIENGATQNFIDQGFVVRKNLPIKYVGGLCY